MFGKYALFIVLWLALIINFRNSSAQVFIDPGVGFVSRTTSGIAATRLNIGFHNIFANRIGLYSTFEFAKPKSQPTYAQDIFGAIIRINEVVSVIGGVGVFSNGLIKNEFMLDQVRKEIGFDINLKKINLNIDLVYSNSSGFGANIGYIIPLGKTSKKYKPLQYFEEGKDDSNLYASMITIPADQLDEPDSTATGELEVVSQNSDEPEPLESTDNGFKQEVDEGPGPSGIDGEKLPLGIYAVDGAFVNYQNAVRHAAYLRNQGFVGAHVGYYEPVNTYYIYLKFAHDDEIIKKFIANVRQTEMLRSCWLLRVH